AGWGGGAGPRRGGGAGAGRGGRLAWRRGPARGGRPTRGAAGGGGPSAGWWGFWSGRAGWLRGGRPPRRERAPAGGWTGSQKRPWAGTWPRRRASLRRKGPARPRCWWDGSSPYSPQPGEGGGPRPSGWKGRFSCAG